MNRDLVNEIIEKLPDKFMIEHYKEILEKYSKAVDDLPHKGPYIGINECMMNNCERKERDYEMYRCESCFAIIHRECCMHFWYCNDCQKTILECDCPNPCDCEKWTHSIRYCEMCGCEDDVEQCYGEVNFVKDEDGKYFCKCCKEDGEHSIIVPRHEDKEKWKSIAICNFCVEFNKPY